MPTRTKKSLLQCRNCLSNNFLCFLRARHLTEHRQERGVQKSFCYHNKALCSDMCLFLCVLFCVLVFVPEVGGGGSNNCADSPPTTRLWLLISFYYHFNTSIRAPDTKRKYRRWYYHQQLTVTHSSRRLTTNTTTGLLKRFSNRYVLFLPSIHQQSKQKCPDLPFHNFLQFCWNPKNLKGQLRDTTLPAHLGLS